jgi:glycosyltransferase involved in cell wall biosynthesis
MEAYEAVLSFNPERFTMETFPLFSWGVVAPKLTTGGPEIWLETLLENSLVTGLPDPTFIAVVPDGGIDLVTKNRLSYAGGTCEVCLWSGFARKMEERATTFGKLDVIITWGRQPVDLRQYAHKVIFLAHGLAPADGVMGKEANCTNYAAVCEAGRDFFLPENRKHVVVIENGVDFERVTPRLGRVKARAKFGIEHEEKMPFVFGWAGRLAQDKNPFLLAEMADPMTHKNDRFRVLFAGDGPLRHDLRTMLASSSGKNRWVGYQDRIGDFLEAIDALVITSYVEACPLILLEAFAAGVPVITTRFPFIDQLEEQHGSLTYRILPEAPKATLLEAMYEVADSRPALGQTPAQHAQGLAFREFNASRFAQRWANYLREVYAQ